MGKNKIDSADYTNMNQIEEETIGEAEDTGIVEGYGASYQSNWKKWLGYYKDILELQAIFHKVGIWTVGTGYTADVKTKKILDNIKGWGKDTFDDIVFNWSVVKRVNGDSFTEIIRDKAGRLINLKPLNPGRIKTIVDKYGMINRYEQWVNNGKIQEWKPKEMFHLAWNRIADEIHGRSTIEKMQWVIQARNEAMLDMRKVFHRYVKPLIITYADTDDETEIATLKVKLDKCVELGENMIMPKDSMTQERMSIPQYSTLDPIPWIRLLQEQFLLAEGVPSVILGSVDKNSEAESKVKYLAWQTVVKWSQKFIERQFFQQVGLKIKLPEPISIEPSLIEDEKKDRPLNKFGMEAGKDQK